MTKEQKLLEDDHWRGEHYRQRMTTAQWRKILLEHRDRIIVCGVSRQLVARNLGCGVVEIHKAALGEERKCH